MYIVSQVKVRAFPLRAFFSSADVDFVLPQDVIKIVPRDFGKDRTQAILDEIDRKYANKVGRPLIRGFVRPVTLPLRCRSFRTSDSAFASSTSSTHQKARFCTEMDACTTKVGVGSHSRGVRADEKKQSSSRWRSSGRTLARVLSGECSRRQQQAYEARLSPSCH